jgi:hypothetical protein
MIEDLLTELSDTGWTISWAFQYGPSEWRMSIIHEEDIGGEQGSYLSTCAFAPSFIEALEDCLSKRAEAEWEATSPITWSQAPKPITSLIAALGLRSAPIRRRV